MEFKSSFIENLYNFNIKYTYKLINIMGSAFEKYSFDLNCSRQSKVLASFSMVRVVSWMHDWTDRYRSGSGTSSQYWTEPTARYRLDFSQRAPVRGENGRCVCVCVCVCVWYKRLRDHAYKPRKSPIHVPPIRPKYMTGYMNDLQCVCYIILTILRDCEVTYLYRIDSYALQTISMIYTGITIYTFIYTFI